MSSFTYKRAPSKTYKSSNASSVGNPPFYKSSSAPQFYKSSNASSVGNPLFYKSSNASSASSSVRKSKKRPRTKNDDNNNDNKRPRLSLPPPTSIIQSFMLSNRSKITSNYLLHHCNQSGVCIAFGKEIDKINRFFNYFTKFDHVSSPPKIISEGLNGFIQEIEYTRDKYKAHAVLKSSKHTNQTI